MFEHLAEVLLSEIARKLPHEVSCCLDVVRKRLVLLLDSTDTANAAMITPGLGSELAKVRIQTV